MPNTIQDAFDDLASEMEADPLRGSRSSSTMDGGDAPQPATKDFVTPVSARPDAQRAGRPTAEMDTSLPEPGGLTQAPPPRPQLTEDDFLKAIKGVRQPQATPEQRAGLPGDTKVTPAGVRGPSGTVRLNAAGQRQYAAAMTRARARYGKFPGMEDASAPQPVFAPGRVEFNAFEGTYAEAEE